jgi:hypothetical protein
VAFGVAKLEHTITCLGVCVCVTIDGIWIGELDFLTTYTHHSELYVITELSLISTLYKSLHVKSFRSLLYVSKSRSLATASNSAVSSASRAHAVTVRRISRH